MTDVATWRCFFVEAIHTENSPTLL